MPHPIRLEHNLLLTVIRGHTVVSQISRANQLYEYERELTDARSCPVEERFGVGGCCSGEKFGQY